MSVPFVSADGDGRKLSVLIVDDSRDVADSAALVLKLAGHTVKAVYSGAAALAAAREQAPKLVFIDLAMPKIDGLILARQMRVLPGMQNAILVCMTGHTTMEHQRLAQEAGFDHFLVKPVEPQELERLAREAAQFGVRDGFHVAQKPPPP